MKRSLNDLIGYTVRASDGEIGRVEDFYFDDERWIVRYMIVDTGSWTYGRKVLISCAALKSPDWESRTFPVDLTVDQVKDSPSIDTEKPVSRQHEADLHSHYDWPIYWEVGPYGGVGGIAFGMSPTSPPIGWLPETEEAPEEAPEADTHLRSAYEVTDYIIHASDGEIGHVEDFMVDDATWEIRYLLVDTRNWLPGKRVLLSTKWIKKVSWPDEQVFVDLTRESIKNSPKFDASKPVSPEYEDALHDYYGRPIE